MRSMMIKTKGVYFFIKSVMVIFIIMATLVFFTKSFSVKESLNEYLTLERELEPRKKLIPKNDKGTVRNDLSSINKDLKQLNDDRSIGLSWSNFMYLATLERQYRIDNPTATPNNVASYLEDKMNDLLYENQNPYEINNLRASSYEIFGITLTSKELVLFASYPIQAIQAYNASKDAISKGEEIYFDSNSDNHNPNAFRHGYWNALMEKRISKTYMKKVPNPPLPPMFIPVELDFAEMFADAHEYGTSGISTDMDFLNNALGREHGRVYKDLDDHDIAIEMKKKIADGKFYRIFNDNIIATNWENLRAQYLYSITSLTAGIGIDGVLHTIDSNLDLDFEIDNKSIVSISRTAFSNQVKMTEVKIPSSVTYIGSDAFNNTNNAAIHFMNRDKVPSSFDMNWNSSGNPVYLNGNLCAHLSRSKIYLNNTEHADLCNDCRTILNKENHKKYVNGLWEYCYDCTYKATNESHVHNYKKSYIPIKPSRPYEMPRHYAVCDCGERVIKPCFGLVMEPGEIAFCNHCGQKMGNDLILLSIDKLKVLYHTATVAILPKESGKIYS